VVEEPKEVKVTETPNNTDAVSGNSIIQDYFKAIGGKEEAAKITSMVSIIGMEMMGRQIAGVEKKMAPNKVVNEMKMGEMTVYKKVFDGSKGFTQQGPQKADFNEAEIKEALDEKTIIPQLSYNNKEYIGKGKVGDEETYRLKVIFPSGRTSVQQYSTKSGLLLQEETTSKEGDMDITSTIEYKNYKKVGALLFPHNIIASSDGQEFNMTITEIKLNEGVTDADFK
jgi:hypothetical protein